ncbi:MAG: hypothetical protein ABSG43_26235, partial [Solirubrobacteraceae bacterium]
LASNPVRAEVSGGVALASAAEELCNDAVDPPRARFHDPPRIARLQPRALLRAASRERPPRPNSDRRR